MGALAYEAVGAVADAYEAVGAVRKRCEPASRSLADSVYKIRR